MVAPALFHLLFKAAWWDAIPYFQLLCIGGCCTILTAINNNFIKVSGHASGIFKIELYKLMLTVGVILLLLHERVLVMVGGIMGVRVVLHLITMVYTQHYTGYRFRDQWHDTYPYMLLALVMGGGVYAVGLLPLCPLALLGMQILTGAAFICSLPTSQAASYCRRHCSSSPRNSTPFRHHSHWLLTVGDKLFERIGYFYEKIL